VAGTYLTDAEVARLTGKKYPKVQARVLAARGWKFALDGAGKVLILRTYHDAMLSGGLPKPAPSARDTPNYKAFERRR
jgi:hypothetical protein